MQPVQIPVGGTQLKGSLFLPSKLEGKAPAILSLHGSQSNQERMFEMGKLLSAMGFVFLTFDMRGHGESPGKFEEFSLKDFLADSIAAYDFLMKQEGVDKANINVIGGSMGGYLAALLSAERAAARLILRAPADYPDESFEATDLEKAEQEMGTWLAQAKEKSGRRRRLCGHSMSFGEKYCLSNPKKDEDIPSQTIKNFKNAIETEGQLTYVLTKDAPHSLRERPDLQKELEKIVVDWLVNQ